MPQIQKRQVLQDTSKILTPRRVSCAVDLNRARISPDGSVLIKHLPIQIVILSSGTETVTQIPAFQML